MIQALIPAITELAGGWLKGKAEQKAAEAKAKVAKAEAEAEVMKVAATHEAGWEKIMARELCIVSRMNGWCCYFLYH